ncbi:unnamed protein product, partial [marine sediment metagenome]
MGKTAFIRENGLGDILMTIPTVRILGKDKKIDYFTNPKYFPLLRNYNTKDVQTFDGNEYKKIYDLRNQLENFKISLNQQQRANSGL